MIEIGGAMRDLLFWDLMYLHPGFICCRRCFEDTPHQNFVSAIPQNPLSQISSLNILCCYLRHNLSQYITCKKIDIRNSSEYEMGAGDT